MLVASCAFLTLRGGRWGFGASLYHCSLCREAITQVQLKVEVVDWIFAFERYGDGTFALRYQDPALSIEPYSGLEGKPRTFLRDRSENVCKAQEGGKKNAGAVFHTLSRQSMLV